MKFGIRVLIVGAALGLCVYAIAPLLRAPLRCNSEFTRLVHSSEIAKNTPSRYQSVIRARQNLSALRPLLALCPLNTNLYMQVALNEQLIGNQEAAVDTYRRALAIDERPEIHQALGNVLFELGRRDEAIQEWTYAARFHPQFADDVPVAEIGAEIRASLSKPVARPKE
jgi:tetratricopeptide (TPR) repeat protein